MRNYELPILRRFSPYGLIASEGPLSQRRTSNLACKCEYDSLCINQVLYLISDWLVIIDRLTKCLERKPNQVFASELQITSKKKILTKPQRSCKYQALGI